VARAAAELIHCKSGNRNEVTDRAQSLFVEY
jgi:hypothetical protein